MKKSEWKENYYRLKTNEFVLESNLKQTEGELFGCEEYTRQLKGIIDTQEKRHERIVTGLQAIIDTQKVELARDMEIIRELRGQGDDSILSTETGSFIRYAIQSIQD